MTHEQQLIQNLRQELTLQTQHRQLLETQGRALLACDRERFCTLQEEHMTLLIALQAQEAARTALLQDGAGQPCPLSALLENVTGRDRRVLETLRGGLSRTAAQIQELSVRNQSLINNELKYIAFMLDLFVEAGRSAENSYGAGNMGRRLLLDRRA
jgi:hypothetical protein